MKRVLSQLKWLSLSLLLSFLICILHPLFASAGSVVYRYDDWHRLVSATYDSGVAIGYTYDAVGNRLTETIAAKVAASPSAGTTGTSLNTFGDNNINSPSQLNDRMTMNARFAGLVASKNAGSRKGGANTLRSNDDKYLSPDTIIYEDARSGNASRWTVLDGPTGAFINNIYAADRKNRVIELTGDGLLNSFLLLKEDGTLWNDAGHKVIQWSMKYTTDFVVSVAAQTTSGVRFLSFTPSETNLLGTGADVFHGLGDDSNDGQWHTYIIDLNHVLHEAQPNTIILSLLGFCVRGSGQVVDIQAHKNFPPPNWPDFKIDGVPDIKEGFIGFTPKL